MTTYGKLTARRKYEDLSMTPFPFNAVNYDEAYANFAEWAAMADRAQAVYDELPASTQPTFFEPVLRPVLAGKIVFEIYTKAALSSKCINQHRASATQLAKDVQTAFAANKSFKANGTVSSVESGSPSWVRRTSATTTGSNLRPTLFPKSTA
jgi:hypothetical protein